MSSQTISLPYSQRKKLPHSHSFFFVYDEGPDRFVLIGETTDLHHCLNSAYSYDDLAGGAFIQYGHVLPNDRMEADEGVITHAVRDTTCR